MDSQNNASDEKYLAPTGLAGCVLVEMAHPARGIGSESGGSRKGRKKE